MGPLGGLLFAAIIAAAPPPPQEAEEFTECSDGYEWDPETQHCKDVDECSGVSPPPCRGSLKCLNHFGGYLCLPRSAAIISPEAPPPPPEAPPPHHQAPPPPPPLAPPLLPPPPHPQNGSCPPGYSADPNGDCRDVDECWGSAPPPCRPSQECINLPGGFRCRCPPGYRHLHTECVDEDECRSRLCSHFCSNSPGSFSCRCLPGFQLGPDRRSCLDVDECSLGLPCSQSCSNTFGSFRCGCGPGFGLGPDGRSCHDLDECSQGSFCRFRCQNLPGSFSCLCPPGYGVQGPHCQDLDECSEGTHGCGGAQDCFNTFGGHLCLPPPRCPPPYTPHPRLNRTCVCRGGVPGCAPLPRWLLHRFLALPSLPLPPTPIFQLRRPPGTRLRLRGGGDNGGGAPPGTFRLRDLTNQSSLLELTRPLQGPQHLRLQIEATPLTKDTPPHPATPSPQATPPPKATPPLALLHLSLWVGEFPF